MIYVIYCIIESNPYLYPLFCIVQKCVCMICNMYVYIYIYVYMRQVPGSPQPPTPPNGMPPLSPPNLAFESYLQYFGSTAPQLHIFATFDSHDLVTGPYLFISI